MTDFTVLFQPNINNYMHDSCKDHSAAHGRLGAKRTRFILFGGVQLETLDYR